MDPLFRIGILWANRMRVSLSKRTALITLLSALGCTLLAPGLSFAAQPLPEYKLKAALLYKFAKFVTWPAEAFAHGSDQLGICVIGENPFGSFLDTLNGRRVRSHNVSVNYFQNVTEIGNDCLIAYVSATETQTLKKTLKYLHHKPILTISDADNFARFGGIIALVLKKKKIRFQINRGSAKQAGIKISSQLLSLATVVESE